MCETKRERDKTCMYFCAISHIFSGVTFSFRNNCAVSDVFNFIFSSGAVLTKNKFETLSNLDEEYEGNFVSLSIHMLMQTLKFFVF